MLAPINVVAEARCVDREHVAGGAGYDLLSVLTSNWSFA